MADCAAAAASQPDLLQCHRPVHQLTLPLLHFAMLTQLQQLQVLHVHLSELLVP